MRFSFVMTSLIGWLDVVDEAKIAVGQDADEPAVFLGDRHAGDVIALHDRQRLAHGRVGRQRDRLDDHARLGALDLVDLGDLILDREVAVDDAETALPRQGDGHPRLGDRVHGRGEDRNGEGDRRRQAGSRC